MQATRGARRVGILGRRRWPLVSGQQLDEHVHVHSLRHLAEPIAKPDLEVGLCSSTCASQGLAFHLTVLGAGLRMKHEERKGRAGQADAHKGHGDVVLP